MCDGTLSEARRIAERRKKAPAPVGHKIDDALDAVVKAQAHETAALPIRGELGTPHRARRVNYIRR